jgi:hypothetical protein
LTEDNSRWRQEHEELQSEHEEVVKKAYCLEKEQTSLTREIQRLKEENIRMKESVSDLLSTKDSLGQLEKSYKEEALREKMRALEFRQEVEVKTTHVKGLEEQNKILERELASATNQIEQTKKTLEEERKMLSFLKEEIISHKERIFEFESNIEQLEIERRKNAEENLRRKIEEEERIGLEKRTERLSKSLEKMQALLHREKESTKDLKNRLAQIGKEVSEKKAKVCLLENRIRELSDHQQNTPSDSQGLFSSVLSRLEVQPNLATRYLLRSPKDPNIC